MNNMPHRTVRTAVFIYDCSRLLFLLGLLPQNAGAAFPILVYAVPNALFPLMSFFLLIRLEASRAYIPLYMTGKILSISVMALWFFIIVIQMKEPRSALPMFILGAADIGSVFSFLGTFRLTEPPQDEEGGE
jgi:hypothetical protein